MSHGFDMSAPFDTRSHRRWYPFLEVLMKAGPGWQLIIRGDDTGDQAETLQYVVSTARRRGVSVLTNPAYLIASALRNPPVALLTNGTFCAAVANPPTPIGSENGVPAVADGQDHLIDAVNVLLATGKLTAVVALADESLRRPTPVAVTAALHARLVHALLVTGRIRDGLAVAERATTVPGLDGDARDDARAAHLFALSLAEPAWARPVIVKGRLRGGALAAVALRLHTRAISAADEARPGVWRLLTRLTFARRLVTVGDREEATAVVQQAATELSTAGPAAAYACAPAIVTAESLLRAGELTHARETAEVAWRSARDMDAELLVPAAHRVLAEVALRTGNLDGSREYLRMLRKSLGEYGVTLWPVHPEWLDVRLAAEQYGPEQAVRLLHEEYPDLVSGMAVAADDLSAPCWFARLGRAAADKDIVSAAVARAKRLAQRNRGLAHITAVVNHTRGIAENDVDALCVATKHYDGPDRATALEDLGLALAATSRTSIDDAARQFQIAKGMYQQMGAAQDEKRVHQRLQDLPTPLVSAAQATDIQAGFSETESLISSLVSDGLTNRQIATRVGLSAHTVNYHLRKIFRKLGINSRVELARIVNSTSHPYAEPSPR
jgi:DNA-binding NarL/FixJ family response regulator